MSVRTMALVWALDLPDSDKIVLLALADCANDEGHCWPSVRSLITKCSKSDRTIQASIKRLVEAGHLTRREVPGKGCNYTVHPRRDYAPEASSPPKGTTQTPEAASDKPSRTINTEAKASLQRVIDAWNEMAKRTGAVVSRVQDASLRQKIRLRLKEHGLNVLLEAIGLLGRSPWLLGKGRDSAWRPDLDWLMTPAKLRKVLEGTYGSDAAEAGLSADEKVRVLEDRAAWYRKRDNELDAQRCLAQAAALRAGNAGRALAPVPAGETVAKIAAGMGR